MVKVQFIGRVLPAPVKVSLQSPEVKWKWQETGLEPLFRVKIGNSFVNVECEIEKYEPLYFGELHKRTSDLARITVNLIAFATGYGLNVILETFIGPDGMPLEIFPYDLALAPLCTAYSLDPQRASDLAAVVNFVITEPPLFRALNDVVEGISVAHIGPVNCGRVVDGIRRMIAPSLKGDAAWNTMHKALNISRKYIDWVDKQAVGPRHADPAFIPGNITTEISHRTWAIMNRFLEYRKRGNKPLKDDPAFPFLHQ